VEIALFMLVHFAAAKRKVARRLSRVALRTGTGRSKMCLKQLYVLTVRGLYINWSQYPVLPEIPQWDIAPKGAAGLARN